MLSSIKIPYGIFEFQNHKKLKELLLQDIDINPYPAITSYDHSISKSDWFLPSDQNRTYVDIFIKEIHADLSEFTTRLNFQKYLIHQIWFQQYYKGDSHSWHNHAGCHYTCIYYVELDDNSPPTQFINPIDESNIFQINVKEGDVLIIPSMIKHQSPIISDGRKTIISFNLSLAYDNNAEDQ